ncbi:S-adenosylmethionine uptake transporter [Cohaesibacter sp. ES.047]|uniref:DMT family transporter n=1 Tax=Cohaesibacter sp. ES.047 TaxID=1798205 RepID=UPI000BB97554|nr:DMT family transporter [Cohaesibacter sp. ES.047]SNY90125.1 S-adenosylmethionine uptake transporter [Cohaesibacter sp. ES.047]
MNQISQTALPQPPLINSGAFMGAIYMICAGLSFALVNLATQYLTMSLGVTSPVVAFGQYFAALLFSLPWLLKVGIRAARTNATGKHLLRVIFAVLGVQAWVAGLAHVPIWQGIALIMTSPFFVTLGAHLILKEKIGIHRLAATILGFVGGMIILAPWSDSFSFYALWPVVAAIFWAGTSLLTKTLTGNEAPEAVTLYLLLFMTPFNGLLAVGSGFAMPGMDAIAIIGLSGFFVLLSQWLIARAYSSADAAYVQPFDHVKLPFNVAAGWIAFGFAPVGQFWLGALLIVAASLYILHRETRLYRGPTGAAAAAI